MIVINLDHKVVTKNDLFDVLSETLKLGRSSFSGWDAFHDALHIFLSAGDEQVRFNDLSNLDDKDRDIFDRITKTINSDLGRVAIAKNEE